MAKERVRLADQRLLEKASLLERMHATLKALHEQYEAAVQARRMWGCSSPGQPRAAC
jgi:hypothetical protein